MLQSAVRYDDPAKHHPCDEGKMDICDFVFHRLISAQTSTIGTEIKVWAVVAMAVSMTIIFDTSLADRPRAQLRPQVESSEV